MINSIVFKLNKVLECNYIFWLIFNINYLLKVQMPLAGYLHIGEMQLIRWYIGYTQICVGGRCIVNPAINDRENNDQPGCKKVKGF